MNRYLEITARNFEWFAMRRVETIKKHGREVIIIGKAELGRGGVKHRPKNGGGRCR